MSRLMVGVSGVRGEIAKTLTPEVAVAFGSAFGTMLGAGKSVVVGRDSRPSGSMVRNAVTSGLAACGVDVIHLGVVSTPGVALMTRHLQADGGIVLTASHNPLEWNGIKFLRPNGLGLGAQQAEQLKTMWESGNFAYVGATQCGGESANTQTHAIHIQAVLDIVKAKDIARRGFKVVLDSINGAGCTATAELMERLGCEFVHLNGEPTGLFAHTPEPIAENLGALCEAVRQHNADIGFAQDPDADRLAMVDETGAFVGEEYTLAVCAAYVLSQQSAGGGSIATNLSTSRMIDDIAAAAGARVFRTPVGEVNVAERMLEAGCVFAGEGNGGVIDPRVVPVRDSLVGIALVLAHMTETGEPFSESIAKLPRYELMKTKFPCSAGAAGKLVGAVKKHFAGRRGVRLDDRDGLRVDLPSGWVHIRASNTEPIIRIFAEGRSRADAQALVADVRSVADAAAG
ncbi:MAG: phosphoglucosamine mutase [Planctomycetes bacterium]|nr:phosphoglucosamine mutase [Planctomycetota bacterium]